MAERPRSQAVTNGFVNAPIGFTVDLLPSLRLISVAMLPARRSDAAHETALETVLNRLTGGRTGSLDQPDGWVTAVRVLPARTAQYAAFPDGISEPLRDVLRARGIEQLYTHQAAAID